MKALSCAVAGWYLSPSCLHRVLEDEQKNRALDTQGMDEGLKEAELEVKDCVGVESMMIHIASGCSTTVVA